MAELERRQQQQQAYSVQALLADVEWATLEALPAMPTKPSANMGRGRPPVGIMARVRPGVSAT